MEETSSSPGLPRILRGGQSPNVSTDTWAAGYAMLRLDYGLLSYMETLEIDIQSYKLPSHLWFTACLFSLCINPEKLGAMAPIAMDRG